jgi:hypothetical protein
MKSIFFKKLIRKPVQFEFYDDDLISWEVERAISEVLSFKPPKDFLIFEPYLETIIAKINKELLRKNIPCIYHPGSDSTSETLVHIVENAYDSCFHTPMKQGYYKILTTGMVSPHLNMASCMVSFPPPVTINLSNLPASPKKRVRIYKKIYKK